METNNPLSKISLKISGEKVSSYNEKFTALLSGCIAEMYELTETERLELARHTVCHVGHNLPVTACGGIGSTRKERLESIMRMAETGVDAVVIPACQLVPREASETELVKELNDLAVHADGVALGIYECPAPYHRLLSPDVFREPAVRNHISFVKDTCCDVTKIVFQFSFLNFEIISFFYRIALDIFLLINHN